MKMEEKIFFKPGDVVTLKQEIPNKPIMLVDSIVKADMTKVGSKPMLLGVKCFWFTTALELQNHRFNTKDLVHYE